MDHNQAINTLGYCAVELTSHNTTMNHNDRFTMVVLCLAGEIEFKINLETIKACAGECVVYRHVTMLEVVSTSSDMVAKVVIINQNVANSIAHEEAKALYDKPVHKIVDPHDWTLLQSAIQCLSDYQNTAHGIHSGQISTAMLQSLIWATNDIAARNNPFGNKRVSTADTYFRHFVNLLSDNVCEQHEVNFYADSLKITPKYLGEICKLKTGLKAKEIISSMLVEQLKREVATGQLSMKTIADKYGFADQSSLGKFFRKMVGISPLVYRRNNAPTKRPQIPLNQEQSNE